MRLFPLLVAQLLILTLSQPALAQTAQDEFMLGLSLEYSPDNSSDFNAAAAHYQRAASLGSREALLALARIHGPGAPLWQGPEVWKEKLLAASHGGWPEASFELAQALEKKTVSADGLEPSTFYLRAAAAGHGPAALRLGELYQSGLAGLKRDPQAAALWLTVAAENHEAEAALALGRMYYESKPAVALAWLEKAQSPEAGFLLGELYLKEKRFIEAVAAFTAAADQGSPQAHLALGQINLDNDFGRRPNPREALKHFKIAAQADLPEGAYQLAKMYLTGTATPKDALTGAYWLNRAAVKGHSQAQAEYEKLTYNFSVGQKKRLERMITDGNVPGMQTPVQ